jgi:integrase
LHLWVVRAIITNRLDTVSIFTSGVWLTDVVVSRCSGHAAASVVSQGGFVAAKSRRGKNEGTIAKRKDGRWAARITTGYLDGKQQRRWLYGKTREEVARKLSQALINQQQGLPHTDGRVSLSDFMETWLVDIAKPSLRPSTYVRYEQIFQQHLKPRLGHMRLAKLTPHDVQKLLNVKLEEGLAAASVRQIHAVLRSALKWALKQQLILRNVATLVSPPSVPKAKVESLGVEESRRFIEATRGNRLEAFWILALATGLRNGEIRGIRWSDLDLEAEPKTLRVSAALQRIDGKLQLVEPKSNSGYRTIALPTFAVSALAAHRTRQLEQRLKAGSKWQESGYVFTTRRGTPLDSSNVSRYYKRVLEKAGIPAHRFHDLRHTCATLLGLQGADARTIMEILGHSQISLTMNTYTHVLNQQKRAAAEKLNDLLAV